MRITAFEWDEANIEHAARHGVRPDDVEGLCRRRPFILKGREGRYLLYGQTSGGRYLFVVACHRGGGILRVITARDMNDAERRLYLKKRR